METATLSPSAASFSIADIAVTDPLDHMRTQLDQARALLLSDPLKADLLLREIIATSYDPELRAEASYVRAKANFFLSRFDEALARIQDARQLSASRALTLQLDILTADCYQQLERYDEAIELVERTLADLVESKDPIEIADLMNTRALAGLHLGKTAAALRDATRGVELAKRAGAKAIHGRLLCTISCIYLTLREWDLVLDFASRSRDICEKAKVQNTLAYSLNMIGSAYLGKRDFATARIYLNRSQQIFEKLGNTNGQVLTWNNLGVSYFNEQNYEKALPYYELSLLAARKIGQVISEAIALGQIAYIHANDPALHKQALREYNEALSTARSKGELRCEEYILSALTEFLEDLGKWQEAYEHQKQLTALREKIYRQQTNNETDKLKRELEAREKEHLSELHKVKANALQEQLTEATTELANFRLRIMQQNERIDLILSQVRSLAATMPGKTSKPLLEAIASLKQDDSSYQGSESQIESKHAEFIQKLSSHYPALSNAELKVAALLRMGLNSKEIANILFTSFRTIETHRHHIRKKLGLEGPTSLVDFFKNF
jgi:tetratricopeptide (TPR) repeat protein/DNA-binding CsgD family transcriptional regulator